MNKAVKKEELKAKPEAALSKVRALLIEQKTLLAEEKLNFAVHVFSVKNIRKELELKKAALERQIIVNESDINKIDADIKNDASYLACVLNEKKTAHEIERLEHNVIAFQNQIKELKEEIQSGKP